jgi:hypothetical protein
VFCPLPCSVGKQRRDPSSSHERLHIELGVSAVGPPLQIPATPHASLHPTFAWFEAPAPSAPFKRNVALQRACRTFSTFTIIRSTHLQFKINNCVENSKGNFNTTKTGPKFNPEHDRIATGESRARSHRRSGRSAQVARD